VGDSKNRNSTIHIQIFLRCMFSRDDIFSLLCILPFNLSLSLQLLPSFSMASFPKHVQRPLIQPSLLINKKYHSVRNQILTALAIRASAFNIALSWYNFHSPRKMPFLCPHHTFSVSRNHGSLACHFVLSFLV